MKKALLATTALVGLVLAANPAHAFDENTWTWLKTVDETVTVTVDINSDLNPAGHVEIQKSQIMEGDVTATVTFDGDYLSNDSTELTLDPDALEDLEQEISASWTLSGTYDANAEGPNVTTATISDLEFSDNVENGDVTVDVENSEVSVQPSNFSFEMDMEGEVTLSAVDLDDLIEEDAVTLDAATELGMLQGNATAIANFQELQTETATFLDEFQSHVALNEDGFGVEATASAGTLENPVEAAVDLNATAISNFFSLEGAAGGADQVLIADITQETNANVMASASTVQDLSGFNNLGGFTGIDDTAALVGRLNATAIGNYASLSFGPSVDLGDITE